MCKEDTLKIVVTGCNGYIGSILCAMLKQSQYKDAELTGIDRNNGPGTEYCDYFIRQDFRTVYFAISQADIVFHLAAEANVPDSILNPGKYFEVNTAGTLHVIQQMKIGSKLINISSAAVYASIDISKILQKEINQTHNNIKLPPNNYGLSKLMAEHIIDSIAPIKNIKATTFRPFNVVGTYNELGQNPDSTHILNSLCRAFFGKQQFHLYGNCIRDYIDVKSLVKYLIDAVSFDTLVHERYNLGCFIANNNEIIRMFEDAVGSRVKVSIEEMRPGDPKDLAADIRKLDKNFKEYNTDLRQCISDHINYYKKVKNIE